ncbi:NADH-quinone oxidoreductase subunit NuoE [Mycolicibacterium hippocampi]|uniref:NADH-quinone oxidoreductase subunit NuoE n=1 Tax=Mycolicibacterium hippocampi TaxID=659824 RepID=UPI00351675BE
MTGVFLELGQRPDEPGPPIHGTASYPADVASRLAADAAVIIARYPQSRSALLPLLHLTQSEDGCLTPAGIAFCAEQLGLSPAEVTAVATFYSMYRRTPTGDYLVGVCTNTLCAIMGGDAILDALQEHLGVDAGQTTADGKVTLEHVECNAACDYAPVVMVNWEFFDNQTPHSARDLVDALRSGELPKPTRGASLCSFRDTARVLAGLPAADREADGSLPGDASLAGLRFAHRHDMVAPAPDSSGSEAVTTREGKAAGDDEAHAAESARDEPAPAPSADVPAGRSTPETDPKATDS